MLICAQLYSVRDAGKTPEGIRETFHKIKEIGYEGVQVSGLGKIDAKELAQISEETSLPIVCTHDPIDRVIGDTDALIEEHKIYGCDVIGLGYMPGAYHGSKANLEKFFNDINGATEKIRKAGLKFAYHNHAFEFEKLEDSDEIFFDIMLERHPEWQYIIDVYWMRYAGYPVTEYMRKVGGERLTNIHFKDMAADRSICACGEGVTDFKVLADLCREIGVKNVLVEQDNAVSFPDMFEQMAISYRHLLPIVK